MPVNVETQEHSIVIADLMPNYKMMNSSNETHTNCLKRMNIAMEIYSLETDLSH